jgi:hypothetical protein
MGGSNKMMCSGMMKKTAETEPAGKPAAAPGGGMNMGGNGMCSCCGGGEHKDMPDMMDKPKG